LACAQRPTYAIDCDKMSSQINFYITQKDLANIEVALKTSDEFFILHSSSPTSAPHIVDTMVCKPGETQWLFYYLVRKSDLDKVLMHYVEKQNYWSIDSVRSPVIEFDSCYLSENILRRGRVYYVNKFYDDEGILVGKPEDFCIWAKQIFLKIRKFLKKHEKDYIGTDAFEWQKTTKNAQLLSM
jgi:hypothetical protein